MTKTIKSATIIPIETENTENAENDTTLTPENSENQKRTHRLYRKSSTSSFFDKFPFPSAQEAVEEASGAFGGGCFIVFLCWLAFMLCTVRVDAGHVGIKKRFGAVADEALEEGLSFIMPFVDSVYHMDTRIRNADQDTAANSLDLQTIQIRTTLQYYINHTNSLAAPLIYRKIGTREVIESQILKAAQLESVKAVCAKFTAESMVQQRASVKQQIKESIFSFIGTTMESKGITNGLDVANVAMTNFDFSTEFNRAIEMKVKAEQEALQAENEKNTTITKAEAAASKLEIEASAKAYRINAIAFAKSRAIELETTALKDNDELITLRGVEKWDGLLPKVNGNGGMILNLNHDDL